MAEIPSLVPLHCAFCLKHLPMDGTPTVACVRCSTPYCSADCRAKDKNEGCGMLWNDAELDGETGTYVRPAPTKHTRAVYQRAERAHPDCGTTESLRFCLASSLWNCGDAPRENLVEAAELLETSAEFARQTYGAEHEDTRFALDFRQRVLDAIEAFDTRPVKRLRTLRLRDVDCRAEVENSDPRRGVDQSRLSRASLRDSQAFFHCLRGTPFAHPDAP